MPTVTVSAGNSPYHVTSGQVDTNDVVISGGVMDVDSGGVASSTVVQSSGALTVSAGGSTSGTVLSGGVETVVGAETSVAVSSGGHAGRLIVRHCDQR